MGCGRRVQGGDLAMTSPFAQRKGAQKGAVGVVKLPVPETEVASEMLARSFRSALPHTLFTVFLNCGAKFGE